MNILKLFKPKFRIVRYGTSFVFEYHLEIKTWYNPFWRIYFNHVYHTEASAIEAFNMQTRYRDTVKKVIIKEES